MLQTPQGTGNSIKPAIIGASSQLNTNLHQSSKTQQSAQIVRKLLSKRSKEMNGGGTKHAMGEPCTGATNLVQCKEGNKVVNILEAKSMNQEIQQVTETRFELTYSTPNPQLVFAHQQHLLKNYSKAKWQYRWTLMKPQPV
jgi:hypothetical protein